MAAAASTTMTAANICVNCARQRLSRRGVGVGATAATTGSKAILQIYSAWALLTLLAASAAIVQSATVSFGDLLSLPTLKPLCSAQHEHFIESDGKESSLIIELKPGSYGAQHGSCSRILSAPAGYGFIVRLILPKLRHSPPPTDNDSRYASSSSSSIMHAAAVKLEPTAAEAALTGMLERSNATATATVGAAAALLPRSCPLNIFSSLDPHTAQWRLDPCQLEDTASEMEDPVRLFHGRVRIIWEHKQHALKSKLMVTVLGKGEQCKDESKHQCLRIGDEPILCISKELVCDRIRHCPYSNEYDSDEDYELCRKQRRTGLGALPAPLDSDILEQWALEVFRNLFANDAPTAPPSNSNSSGDSVGNNSTTQLRKVHTKDMKKPSGEAGSGSPNAIGPQQQQPTAAAADMDGKSQDNVTAAIEAGSSSTGSGFTRRNSTRHGLHSDLSKYGPWGYLMLGMLLCGGALLICGLWASASQHAVNNEREAALAAANGAGLDAANAASPPNYEELDPPPAYSVLFPNQKAASSNTLSALEAPSTTAAAAAAAAAAIAAATATATEAATATVAATLTTAADPATN
ncbi:uncharacterized protein LOC108596960 [Drosophila busckii]|uniref:uncharacterized protein LOC108596960 n=1 Tax=Drosophila busckii TaxID=30019 RepID=UPI00083F48DC|nr:uncharacterized protein LOC108596960 [Drosophila busckii]